MIKDEARDLSGLIAAWGRGDEQALNSLMPLVYSELRRIARAHLGPYPRGNTLESAVLANEAYLKLVRAGRIRCENRVHFLALCSQIVRRLLVDHARKRGYVKRGGGTVQVSLDEGLLAGRTRQADVLALHDALASLSELDPRKARLVELRYFGGYPSHFTGVHRINDLRACSWVSVRFSPCVLRLCE